MANTLRFLALAVALTLSVASFTGCLAVAAAGGAAGGVAYVRGDLEATIDEPLEAVSAASRKAIERLGFSLISANTDALAGKFVARTAQDKKVKISIVKTPADTTEVSIRVGILGDESLSLQILDKIKAAL